MDKRNIDILVTAIFALAAFSIIGKAKECIPGLYHECCSESCNFDYNNFRLLNDLWGKGPNEVLTSYVYYYDGNKYSGWRWDRPNPIPRSGAYIDNIYPEIIVGRQPWPWGSTNSTWIEFPKKVSDISKLKADLGYNYLQQPTTGLLNFAYDIWLANTSIPVQADSSGIYAEIMVWIDCGMSCQPGTLIGNMNDGFNNYNVYYVPRSSTGAWPQWIYFAFVRQPPGVYSGQTYYSTDFKKMIDYLKIKGLSPLISDKYIHGIELGHEIKQGNGKIEINKYNIFLNDKIVILTC